MRDYSRTKRGNGTKCTPAFFIDSRNCSQNFDTFASLPKGKAIKTERCQSGRTSELGKFVYLQGYRGFESHPLRNLYHRQVKTLYITVYKIGTKSPIGTFPAIQQGELSAFGLTESSFQATNVRYSYHFYFTLLRDKYQTGSRHIRTCFGTGSTSLRNPPKCR